MITQNSIIQLLESSLKANLLTKRAEEWQIIFLKQVWNVGDLWFLNQYIDFGIEKNTN